MKVSLTIIGGPQGGRSFDFTEPDYFLVGRNAKGSKAHLKLSAEDRFVSRNHFLLEINPPDCFLRDAGSLNGTFVIQKEASGNRLLFLKGRKAQSDQSLRSEIKHLVQKFRCASRDEVDEVVLRDGDMIKVGQTVFKIEVVDYTDQSSGLNDQVVVKGGSHERVRFDCQLCGKPIGEGLLHKNLQIHGDKASTEDFICKGCRTKGDQFTLDYVISCWRCGKDLSKKANVDYRAGELYEIALYWCEDCASFNQDTIPLSNVREYRIIRLLGTGGFGEVYLAWHEPTCRIVALKLGRGRIKQNRKLFHRFEREINIMKKLSHPNIVRLYDSGTSEEENYYFASEYLAEGSLVNLCRNFYNKTLPIEKACRYVNQALEGVAFFHRRGYVHRDLKPENILVRKDSDGNFVAKVADFGLAKSYLIHGGTITGQGEYAGTIIFCPPEQILNFRDVKPSTDVYAMGISLYYLLTGVFPYDFPTRNQLREMISRGLKPRNPISIILEDKPVPIDKKRPDINKDLARVINKAISKEASERYSDAEELRIALEGCVA